MLSYCKKCGRFLFNILEIETTCDVCGSQAYEVPNKYIDNFRWRDGDGKQALTEELVKTSSEFDQYLFDHKEEILAQKNAEFDAKIAHGKAIRVECPYCHSTNTEKISATSKIVHTAIAGVFAMGRNSKQWHCNSCQADF